MQSTLLELPYLQAAQAQKHVTHNEALRRLDACVQLSVETRGRGAPPAEPVEGARFLVAEPGEGEWQGQGGRIAARQDGAWSFLAPRLGWLAFVEDERLLLLRDADGWRPVESPVSQTPERLGINATADGQNRLAVRSHATLFDHEGSGHRMVLNKAGAPDTASILFQENYSGRAEIGLAGAGSLVFKTSATGAQWRDALRVDAATARPRFPQGAGGIAIPIMGNSGSAVLAGQTRFLTPGLNGPGQAAVSVPVPMAGRFAGLACFTAAAPGAGQSWRFTLQKLSADTALTCTIGPGLNQAADLQNSVPFNPNERWSIKMVASADAASSGNVLFSLLFVPD